MSEGSKARAWKIALLAFNAALVIAAIVASLIYAGNVRATQVESRENSFVATVESMKSVSQNYLDAERGYVSDWAEYITKKDMTRAEALDFLRSSNTSKERFAHIVDMNTFEAWSASLPAGKESIDTYLKYYGDMSDTGRYMNTSMFAVFNGKGADKTLVGSYRIDETHSLAVSVGARVTLKEGSHTKDYLLLRAIPTESLKKSWVFPTEYQTAEVGLITNNGDYVIQSSSMKSRSFPEYIRAYNFPDDYNKGEQIRVELGTTDMGTMSYRDFKSNECLWCYSSFGDDSNLKILGMVDKSTLVPSDSAWSIVFIVCGALAVLLIIDSLYFVQLNRRLRVAAQKANEASQAKTRFLSAMSHDIRTPMNAVLGMLTLAKRNIGDTEYTMQCLDKASNAGNHLLTLINDVLDISKIESGQLSLLPSEVSLPKLFDELGVVISPLAESRQINLKLELAELEHPYVLADSMRLTQIYTNLVSNAVKYTDCSGEVVARLYEEQLPNKELTRVVFVVSDNGIGMSEEFQKHMYQSFSRAVSTQVNRTQGSGLGLSIVKQVVDAMGGSIVCESAPNEGTTFTVVVDLVVIERRGAVDNTAAGEDSDLSGLHLLVAEDNELNWEIIQAQLESCGITCKHVENGRICLEELKTAPLGTYDAVLMDVQMPEMTGIEATREIRKLPERQNGRIPIIAMTADAFAEDVKTCLENGMNGHVAKPINTVKLRGYLQKVKLGTL